MKLAMLLPCVTLLCTLWSSAEAGFLSDLKQQLLQPPPPHRLLTAPRAAEQWFEQTLDHFDPTDNRTWRQRYFSDEKNIGSGRAFLMINGEAPALDNWLYSGQMAELAEKFAAATFILEHRYYGYSRPTLNTSTENLRYLSSEQALADVASFVMSFKDKYKHWVVFGGSYAGSLAAWARIKYPHLILGAVSSSGPVRAETNFLGYYEVVARSIASHSELCLSDLHDAMTELSVQILTEEGAAKVSKDLQLCSPLNVSSADDVAVVFDGIASVFASTVQYNSGVDVEHDSISVVCDMMTDHNVGDSPYERLVHLLSDLLKNYACVDSRFSAIVDEYSNTAWSNAMMRQWTYQTCTEFGYYQTSDSSTQPFGHLFPLNYSIDICSAVFGHEFDLERVDRGVFTTNMMYGADHPDVSNVVFVHGSIDPWSALGVVNNISLAAPAIYINGTSHCYDMYGTSPDDPPQLKAAHREISQLVGSWLPQ